MERNVISWTPENWLTVLLMVWLGGMIIAVGVRTFHRVKEGS